MNITKQELKNIVNSAVVEALEKTQSEITAKKYSEDTGIAYAKVKRFCRNGVLKARKIQENGDEVKDFSKIKKGEWYLNPNQQLKPTGVALKEDKPRNEK